jgi:hypothetical protein
MQLPDVGFWRTKFSDKPNHPIKPVCSDKNTQNKELYIYKISRTTVQLCPKDSILYIYYMQLRHPHRHRRWPLPAAFESSGDKKVVVD